MNNSYVNIYFKGSKENTEMVLAEVSDLPILGVIESDETTEISFNKEDLTDSINNELASILEKYNCEEIDRKGIEERNWNEEWEKEVPAIHINNKIGIAPEWKMQELNEDIQIEINPKMSFGTGNHATTRLMCRQMSEMDLSNEFWIDAGTGTGVLAILAEKLGSKNVLAFDNNEWSINNTIENCEKNNVQNVEIKLFDLDNETLPKSNGITANILTPVIIRNMDKFFDSIVESKGYMILSGILSEEKQDIIDAASKFNMELVEYIEEDEWASFKYKVV